MNNLRLKTMKNSRIFHPPLLSVRNLETKERKHEQSLIILTRKTKPAQLLKYRYVVVQTDSYIEDM